jgi:hypothetical protein
VRAGPAPGPGDLAPRQLADRRGFRAVGRGDSPLGCAPEPPPLPPWASPPWPWRRSAAGSTGTTVPAPRPPLAAPGLHPASPSPRGAQPTGSTTIRADLRPAPIPATARTTERGARSGHGRRPLRCGRRDSNPRHDYRGLSPTSSGEVRQFRAECVANLLPPGVRRR